MAIDGEDQGEAHGGFGCGDGDREDDEEKSRQCFRMRTVAPEGEEVEVCGVEHQFDSGEHENGAAAGQRSCETDRKKQAETRR